MIDGETQENGVIESFYSKHDSLLCLIGMMIVIIILEIYASLFITQFIIELSIIIWVTTSYLLKILIYSSLNNVYLIKRRVFLIIQLETCYKNVINNSKVKVGGEWKKTF